VNKNIIPIFHLINDKKKQLQKQRKIEINLMKKSLAASIGAEKRLKIKFNFISSSCWYLCAWLDSESLISSLVRASKIV
jgi:hypothetical protein